jgi:hypothetical protein
MKNPHLKLALEHLHVESFHPAPDEPAPGDHLFYMAPGPTAGESTCIQYTCNACTFTCHC